MIPYILGGLILACIAVLILCLSSLALAVWFPSVEALLRPYEDFICFSLVFAFFLLVGVVHE